MTIQNLIDELQQIVLKNPESKNSEVLIKNWELGLYYLQEFELKNLTMDELDEIQTQNTSKHLVLK